MKHSIWNLGVLTRQFGLHFFNQDVATPELFIRSLLDLSSLAFNIKKCPTGAHLIGESRLRRRNISVKSRNGFLLKFSTRAGSRDPQDTQDCRQHSVKWNSS